MFNHPEIKFLQSDFQCLHLSACVRIFSQCDVIQLRGQCSFCDFLGLKEQFETYPRKVDSSGPLMFVYTASLLSFIKLY